jgi:hypothetical protein
MLAISVAPALIVIVAFVPVVIEGRAMALTPAPAEIDGGLHGGSVCADVQAAKVEAECVREDYGR